MINTDYSELVPSLSEELRTLRVGIFIYIYSCSTEGFNADGGCFLSTLPFYFLNCRLGVFLAFALLDIQENEPGIN